MGPFPSGSRCGSYSIGLKPQSQNRGQMVVPAVFDRRNAAVCGLCRNPLAGAPALLSGLSNVRYLTLCGLKPDIASGPKSADFVAKVG
jgi:hypothetical protein